MYISTREMVISIICNACGVLGLILWAIEAHKSNANQHFQDVESVKSVENNGDIIVRSNLYPFRVVEADRKTENSSEKPNNCEHITEDGVTCAKYPACDDCLDNPLNKVKGSERLVKGSERSSE